MKFEIFTKSSIYIVQENYFPVMSKFVIQSANPQAFQLDNQFNIKFNIYMF